MNHGTEKENTPRSLPGGAFVSKPPSPHSRSCQRLLPVLPAYAKKDTSSLVTIAQCAAACLYDGTGHVLFYSPATEKLVVFEPWSMFAKKACNGARAIGSNRSAAGTKNAPMRRGSSILEKDAIKQPQV